MPSTPASGAGPAALLSVGEIAARSGLATSAVRYYEELGLIASTRTAGGQRRYHRSTLRRVATVQAGRRAGIPLVQIRADFADLPVDKAPTRRQWERLARRWKGVIAERIRQLEQLESTLDGCIGCGCLSLRRCPIYNKDDRAGALGPGARWLLGDDPSAST